MSRAGVIALLLLGSGLAPGLVATPAPAAAVPAAVVPLAPELPPAQPTVPPTPGEETPGDVEPEEAAPDTTAEDPEAGDPLQVTITGLSPSTLPRRGPVTISGQVTNLSEDAWSDLTVYAATSATPITTEEALLAAEDSPSGVEPPDYQRLVDPDLFGQVGDLGPGESTSYRLSIPRSDLELPADPGIYRVGVQVLGTENGGRAEGADGRARVLMASVPAAQRTQLALAVQMRRRTVRTATGEVDHVTGWQRTLSRRGRLRQVVRLLASADDYPLSFVLDPAVVEAVGSLAEGNTGVDLADTGVDGLEQASGEVDDPPPPTEPGEPDPTEETETEEPTPTEVRTAADAVSWLRALRAAVDGRDVRSIPYGDLDLGAAARHGDEEIVGRSLAAGISLLSEYGVQATGIAAPYHGLLGQQTADALPEGVPTLVKRRSFVAAVVDGDEVQLLDDPAPVVPAALSGPDGAPIWTFRAIRTEPGSAAGVSALEMRQRILARGGVQALSNPEEPLVVVLPPQWNPGSAWARSDFFEGLRAPWLTPVPLEELQPDEVPVVEGSRLVADSGDETTEPTPTTEPEAVPETEPVSALALSYPVRQLESEVPRKVFRATRRLASTGSVMGSIVVAETDTLGPRIERLALLGVSFHTRGHVPGMTGRLRAADAVLSALLRDVEVLAPRFVRMASETGSFLVPVVNGLQVPVRVQLRPEVAEPGLRLEVPEPVEVPAQGRQAIRVAVTAQTIGIRSVRVSLVTVGGERLYRGPTFSVRSSQVARWVWVAMAVGSLVLFVAIAVRIRRRVRTRRATHGPTLMRGEP